VLFFTSIICGESRDEEVDICEARGMRCAGKTLVKCGVLPRYFSPQITRCDFPAPRIPHPAFYPRPNGNNICEVII